MIDKVLLFKVGCVKDQSLRFDQSFRVKKVCIDDTTIQRFCDGRVENVVCFLIPVYYASPTHTPDDDISLRILRKNIKFKKGVV